MRKIVLFGFLTILLAGLVGCSIDRDHTFEANIYSDQPADGDIAYDPVLDSFTITNGPDVLYYGIDDADPNLPEYRAFLDFPLDGSTGYSAIPSDARIVSATLEVYIDSVEFAETVPTLIDLVEYPINGLEAFDFDSAPLVSIAINLFRLNQGRFLAIDVTSLMREAQWLALPDFQVRFLLDLTADFGFVGIEDLPTVTLRAPLLNVLYRH